MAGHEIKNEAVCKHWRECPDFVVCIVAYTPTPRFRPWWHHLKNIPWEWSTVIRIAANKASVSNHGRNVKTAHHLLQDLFAKWFLCDKNESNDLQLPMLNIQVSAKGKTLTI